MKKLILVAGTVIFCLSVSAQEDSTKRGNKSDTIRIGGMVIIRKPGKNKGTTEQEYKMRNRRSDKRQCTVHGCNVFST